MILILLKTAKYDYYVKVGLWMKFEYHAIAQNVHFFRESNPFPQAFQNQNI